MYNFPAVNGTLNGYTTWSGPTPEAAIYRAWGARPLDGTGAVMARIQCREGLRYYAEIPRTTVLAAEEDAYRREREAESAESAARHARWMTTACPDCAERVHEDDHPYGPVCATCAEMRRRDEARDARIAEESRLHYERRDIEAARSTAVATAKCTAARTHHGRWNRDTCGTCGEYAEAPRRRCTVDIDGHTVRVLASSHEEAIEKCCVRVWGRRASWFPDSGVRGMGQVVDCTDQNGCGGPTVTGRTWAEVSLGWK
jgi:hypothetical protein